MFSAIYIEDEVKDSERVAGILARFPDIPHINCERYGEVFNRKRQSFRLQKQAPALILASKHGKAVLPAPAGYGFTESHSFYFSHMLNCLYDCRYCFLQGMYRSANYVLFVNYEDFASEIRSQAQQVDAEQVFYSGYDCDSLAMDPVSEFCAFILPLFDGLQNATLELRTKSTQVRALLDYSPIKNCVIAMSFTAHDAASRWEHRTPSIAKRLEALLKLQQAGWNIALRFEPIIMEQGVEEAYQQLFAEIFSVLDADQLHSVSTGLFRMPSGYYRNITKQFPDEPLFALPTNSVDGVISLRNANEAERLGAVEKSLFNYVDSQRYYRCAD